MTDRAFRAQITAGLTAALVIGLLAFAWIKKGHIDAKIREMKAEEGEKGSFFDSFLSGSFFKLPDIGQVAKDAFESIGLGVDYLQYYGALVGAVAFAGIGGLASAYFYYTDVVVTDEEKDRQQQLAMAYLQSTQQKAETAAKVVL